MNNMKTLKMNIYPFPEFLLKAIALLAIFFAPISSIMLAVSALIIADCITGIWSSKVKGVPFSSSRFFSSVTKLIVYLLLIMISHLVQLHLVPEVPLLKLSIFFITSTEFLSFVENVSIIAGRDVVGFFKEALNKMKPNSNK